MTRQELHQRAIRLWLYVVAGLVVLMVVVGGATRLTDSGLSIVEWRPVTGTIPPFTEEGWNAELAKYRTSSEYQMVNRGMTLDEFKRIYWWEWGHRLLGRIIGVVFVVPLLLFQWRGWIEARLKWRLWVIFGLGGLQGAIGWWMVASGLVGRVDVAQERLAVHLTMACLILMAIVWTVQAVSPRRLPPLELRRLAPSATALLLLLVVQIALGGLVAGLKAGLVYNTWPLIDGALIPPAAQLLFHHPLWTNLVDNHLTVQFMHRMAAYLLVAGALLHALDCVRRGGAPYRNGAVALAAVLLLQMLLGIATLLWHVPISLALSHQLVAILALVVATAHVGDLYMAPSGSAALAEGRNRVVVSGA
jgi:cytochrome c oxidase assembly protein subunit 15